MIVIWIIIALCGICSLILLSGRGSILIAGYNTMSKEDQEQYDEKKLCRITGTGMLIITLLTAILEVFGEKIPDWFWIVYAVLVVLIAVGIMILSNIICKIKENTGSRKRSYNKAVICVIAASIVFSGLIMGIVFSKGKIEIAVSANRLEIQGYWWSDYEIKTEEIEKIELTENFQAGTRTNGFSGATLLQGEFENEEQGKYTLYAYKDCKAYIILHTKKGDVVINEKTEKETRELYHEIEKTLK